MGTLTEVLVLYLVKDIGFTKETRNEVGQCEGRVGIFISGKLKIVTYNQSGQKLEVHLPYHVLYKR